MARFDVYRVDGFDDLVLDCQADALDELSTRFVVPLLPAAQFRRTFVRLNPVFAIDGRELVMATQSASALPVRVLKQRVATLRDEHDAIMNALDMLIMGY